MQNKGIWGGACRWLWMITPARCTLVFIDEPFYGRLHHMEGATHVRSPTELGRQ
jgi:hypothetical protein